MAYTQTDLNNLKAALAQGVLTVEVNGKRVTYRSLNEMIRIQKLMQADIDAASGTPRSRSSLARFSKG